MNAQAELGAALYQPGHRSDVRAVALSHDDTAVTPSLKSYILNPEPRHSNCIRSKVVQPLTPALAESIRLNSHARWRSATTTPRCVPSERRLSLDNLLRERSLLTTYWSGGSSLVRNNLPPEGFRRALDIVLL